MNGMPGGRQQTFWKTGMMLPCLAYVSKVRTIDQRVHVDCYDPETSEQWHRLPLFVLGGSATSYLAIPPAPFPRSDVQQPEEEDGAQVIVLPRHKQGPIALGCVQHPSSEYEDAPREQEAVDDTSDHPLPTTAEEHIWRHAGIRLQLTSDGSLVIDTTQSKKPVRIQLSDGGRLRVSRGGAAGGRLVLWHRLSAYLGDLKEFLTNMNNRLTYEESRTTVIGNTLIAAGLIPAAVADVVGNSYQDLTGIPNEAVPSTPNMAAAAIDVSKDLD